MRLTRLNLRHAAIAQRIPLSNRALDIRLRDSAARHYDRLCVDYYN